MNITPPMGGTEILVSSLGQLIPDSYSQAVNLIVSNTEASLLDPSRKNILWQHLNVDQAMVQNLKDSNYVAQLDAIVFVSHWQYNQFRTAMGVPAFKSVVIPNATTVCSYLPRNNAVKRIVYSSTPWRGLDVLLSAWNMLDNANAHLDVFSSTQIYGSEFAANNDSLYQELWDFCRNHPRITLHGHQPNSTVKHYLSQADILAYPSTWEETFCLSALEALTAGCHLVTTNLGALPEVAGPWATYVSYGANKKLLIERYATALYHCINNLPYDGRAQSEYFNRHLTWPTVIPKWLDLFDKVLRNS